MIAALLSDHVAEIRRQIDDEGGTARIGPPLDSLRKDLGSFVLRPPPLDETRVHVDDPVLRHVPDLSGVIARLLRSTASSSPVT
jgi:hypothetical protein